MNMSNIKNEEIEYLTKNISEILYNPKRFNIFFGNGKYVFGATSPEGKETIISKVVQYKTLYDTIQDLDWKIKRSFTISINYAYSKEVQENFNLITINSEEEQLAYYYIENALFRTSSLWDMLAQLYCLFYKVNLNHNKIYYNKIFNPNSPKSNKFREKAREINDYLNEDDNIDGDKKWNGNHKYCNHCRNKMIHRNSPNISVLSDYDMSFKDHLSFMLKRIIEDYVIVSKYIGDILDEIEKDLLKEFN